MLLLTSTSDKLQLVTGGAGSIDVHCSWVDYNGTTTTPGRTNTAITTATTTDIVASPGASTQRNVKTMNVRNKHATNVTTVTVQHTDGTTVVELHKVSLNPGDCLEYVEGVGFFDITAPVSALSSINLTDVTANAADTYLTGSSLQIGGRVKAGTFLVWRLCMSKTGAGVATPIFNLRFGTAGSTADTARATFTGVAQTANADKGWADVVCLVRDAGATGVVSANLRFQHNLTTTGLANAAQEQLFQTTSSTFDLTGSNLIVGLSVNPGASGVWTFQTVSVTAINNI